MLRRRYAQITHDNNQDKACVVSISDLEDIIPTELTMLKDGEIDELSIKIIWITDMTIRGMPEFEGW